MFNREQISRFISNKFIKVYEAIEENTDLLVVFLKLLEWEVTLLCRLNHVIHLTKEINEQNRLMIKVLKSVHLLLIKILHLMRRNDFIIVQVDY